MKPKSIQKATATATTVVTALLEKTIPWQARSHPRTHALKDNICGTRIPQADQHMTSLPYPTEEGSMMSCRIFRIV